MSRKIIGITVGTQLPKPNFKQTDPTKGDYIKNKPDFDGLKSQVDNKADLVNGKVPLEQLPDDIGSGGGGLTEVFWKDIKDAPFGEEGMKIVWDGDSSSALNIVPIEGAEASLYQITNEPISAEDIIGATFVCDDGSVNGITSAITQADIYVVDSGNPNSYVVFCNGAFPILMSVAEAETVSFLGISVTLPSAGIWFIRADDGSNYTKSLDLGYSIKQIDSKYIPENISIPWDMIQDKPFGEEGMKIAFNGNIEDALDSKFLAEAGITLCQVSTEPILPSDIIGLSLIFHAGSDSISTLVDAGCIVPVDIGNANSYLYAIGGQTPALFNIAEAETISIIGMSITFPSAGVWFIYYAEDTYTSSLEKDYLIKQIDPKFIPANLDFNLDDYYTKDEIDNIALGGNVDLSGYYTKNEIDNLIGNVDLSGYYTKGEIDNLIGDIDTILDEIDVLIGE